MNSASVARTASDSAPGFSTIEFVPQTKSNYRRRKFVLSAWAYGFFAAVTFVLGLILFLSFAYQAVGGTGILIAGSVIAMGIFFFVKFISKFPG